MIKYNNFYIQNNKLDTNKTKNDDLFRSAFNDLMIWAILTRRHKMALFFFKRGDETLAKVKNF